MPSSSKERLGHLFLPATAQTFRYTSPGTVRHTFTTPQRDRHVHAEKLIGELREVEQALPNLIAEQHAFGLGGANGIYLSFESQRGYALKFESLDFRRSGIELCSVKEEAARTIATVFVPDGKLGHFLGKVEQYRDSQTDTGKPRNKELVESIEHIKVAALQALWTDPVELFPESGVSIWWEAWLRRSVFPSVSALQSVQRSWSAGACPRSRPPGLAPELRSRNETTGLPGCRRGRKKGVSRQARQEKNHLFLGGPWRWDFPLFGLRAADSERSVPAPGMNALPEVKAGGSSVVSAFRGKPR